LAEKTPSGKDAKKRKEMVGKALKTAERALAVKGGQECSAAHKW
jgi:hypothetical protein